MPCRPREFLGARIDLDETYEWGVESLARITAEQEAIAREVAGPGATTADAIAVLNADPANQLHGTGALREWMQRTADEVIAALDGKYFILDPRVRTIKNMITPSTTGGITTMFSSSMCSVWTLAGSMSALASLQTVSLISTQSF